MHRSLGCQPFRVWFELKSSGYVPVDSISQFQHYLSGTVSSKLQTQFITIFVMSETYWDIMSLHPIKYSILKYKEVLKQSKNIYFFALIMKCMKWSMIPIDVGSANCHYFWIFKHYWARKSVQRLPCEREPNIFLWMEIYSHYCVGVENLYKFLWII